MHQKASTNTLNMSHMSHHLQHLRLPRSFQGSRFGGWLPCFLHWSLVWAKAMEAPVECKDLGGPWGQDYWPSKARHYCFFYGRFMRKELGNTCVEVRVAKSRWRPPAQPSLGLGGLDFSIFRRVEVIFRRLFQERRSRRPYIGRYNVNHSQVSHKILLWTKLFI